MSKANDVIDAVIDTVDDVWQELDTTVVQTRSVLNFMYALGYTLDVENGKGRFVTDVKQFQGNRWLSFDTAKRLHNSTQEDWTLYAEGLVVPTFVDLYYPFTALGVRLAQASKLVERVKIRVDKNGNVITLSNLVVPLNSVVKSLLNV